MTTSPGEKKKKGIVAREFILTETLKIFNQEGIFLTYKELSSKLNVGTSFITNHFPTKDDLFIALQQNYEAALGKAFSVFVWKEKIDFQQQALFLATAMDVQYEHRSVILFSMVASKSQTSVVKQMSSTWQSNKAQLQNKLKQFVSAGLLKEEILLKDNFELFRFAYINLLTTWLVSYILYDDEKSYASLKPRYLKGIFQCFYPYLTRKGESQMSEVKY